MNTALLVLQIVVVLWVVWGLLEILGLWLKRRYQQPDTSPLIYFVTTKDKWRIAVHRYPTSPTIPRTPSPSSNVPSEVGEGSFLARSPLSTSEDGEGIETTPETASSPTQVGLRSDGPGLQPRPVLLCHGLASNRFQVDLEGKSLARFLQKNGFDVWVIEFRGAGFSSDPKKNNLVSFDEYASQDLPAVIEKILQETNQPKLHLVGYSTGALASMVYAAKHDEHIASLVSLGAPVQFSEQGYLHRFVTMGSFLSTFGDVKLSTLTALFSPLGGRMNPRILKALMNRENMSADDIRSGLANAVQDFSRDSLRQYEDWVMENQLRSLDHSIDYRKELSQVKAPLFLIAGSQDILAPASSIAPMLELAQSTIKQLKIAGKKDGCAKEYGHIDLAYGERVEQEIFTWIHDWLSKARG